MKAIVTVVCENGMAKIECKSLAALGDLTKKFDLTGTQYSIDYVKDAAAAPAAAAPAIKTNFQTTAENIQNNFIN